MNNDNFLCLLLPIIIFVLFSFVFLLPASVDLSCQHDDLRDEGDDYVMYYLPEDFTDEPKPTDTVTSLPSTSLPSAPVLSQPLPSAPVVPSCFDTNAITIGNNVCYSCPDGASFNANNDGCTVSTKNPLTCVDPNAQLIGSMCYGCPPGQIYDQSQLACVSTAPSSLVTPSGAPSNIQYKCSNDDDTLVGSSCYACSGRSSSFNPKSLKCEQALNAYSPIDSYTLKSKDTACNTGYFKDYMNCYKCNNDDSYMSGKGCMNIQSSLPLNVVPAVVDDFPFSSFDT
jgi:hypothetical protein